MRSYLIGIILVALSATAGNRIYDPQVKSLQAVVNQDWLSLPIMRLHGNDLLHVSFDELSHDYHRYTYRIERCEADWSRADDVFESDWLVGFNDNVIEDFGYSINTTVPYTHYELTIPNDRCQLKMSGNYRLHVNDDGDTDDVLTIDFMVTEQAMQISMTATTNTDIDTNERHQQLIMGLNFGTLSVTCPDEQIQTVVMQNGRTDNWCRNTRPTAITHNGMEWKHCRNLIFEAGNEYRKFEVLDPSHPTMGIDDIHWDGEYYQVFPFQDDPRPNYLYDEDANGAFYIRNSDNRENDTASDYVFVNYRLKTDNALSTSGATIVIDGRWTTEDSQAYEMNYDEQQGIYTAQILQKQGYYSYQYLLRGANGQTQLLPSEGNFFQTENRYQALVYYKGTGERTWRLVAYHQLTLK